ncbi:Endo-1,4-beta-xylanase A precursor [compost metagenome]
MLTIRALRAADPGLQADISGDLKEFIDSGQVAAYAAEDLAAMVELGYMNGQGHAALNPKGTATRAQAAQVLYKIYLQQQ